MTTPLHVMQALYDDSRLFAGAIGLIVGGEVVATHTVGAAADTLFEIGSITKMLTTIAALDAVRDGLLDLDAPIEEAVSGLRFDDRRGASVTLRHLLSHTSRLPAAGRDWGPPNPGALRRVASEDVAGHRFHAEPGTVACYSSTAISLVGLALEEATGDIFPEILRQRVLDPAGMNGARYPEGGVPERVSWPNVRSESGWRPVPRLADNPGGYPSGFLMASVDDLLALAISVIDGRFGAGLLETMSSATASRWVEHAPSPWTRLTAHYGLGCFHGTWNGQAVIRHGGVGLTSNNTVDFFPETGSAIVLLTNGADDGTFVELFQSCYEEVAGGERRPAVTWPGAEENERDLAGHYLDVDNGGLVEVRGEQSGWELDRDGEVSALVGVGGNRWLARTRGGDTPVGIPGNDADVSHLVIWGALFVRIDPPSEEPVPDDVVGEYRDGFWDASELRIRITRDAGETMVQANGHSSPGRWIGGHRLICDHGLVHFTPSFDAFVLGRATTYVRVG